MRFSRRFVLTAAAAMVLGGGVTAASAATTASPDSSLWKRTELYFGTAEPNGGEVTEKEFADSFSAKDITPRFPDGFTQFAATGQWRSGSGAITKERSIVLVVLYPPTNQHANEDLEQIRTDYKHLFDQESVLRTDSTARVSF